MEEPMNSLGNMALEKGIVNEASIAEAKLQLGKAYEDIIEVIKEYLDMPESEIKIVAIWIIGTYFHSEFDTFPYLFFNAMRGSGKTRVLKLISALSAGGDGSVQNNLTEAVLFRIAPGTTTCIDEFEQVGKKEKQTLRELLNSAYKRGMVVKRMRKAHTKEGETQITDTFRPYFPIAMANIWGMDEVLGDRAITLVLEKSNNPAITKVMEDFEKNEKIKQIKRTLNKVSAVSVMSLRKRNYITAWNSYIKSKYSLYTTTYTTLTTLTAHDGIYESELFNKIDKKNIMGRNLELMFPLLLISKELNDSILDEVLEILSELVNARKHEEYTESKDVLLYQFISTLGNARTEYHQVKDITTRFKIFIGDLGEEEEKWLNERWVGKALKRLNLIIDKKRMPSGRFVTLNVEKAFEKAKIFHGEKL